jgi:hypothetical protein
MKEQRIKARRVFRANRQTAEQRAEERAFRDEIQRRKPSLEDLIASGECDPEDVMTMGEYFERAFWEMIEKRRKEMGISWEEAKKQLGLD